MRSFVFVLILLFAIQCSVKNEQIGQGNDESTEPELKTANAILNYERKLARLTLSAQSSLHGLQLFRELGLNNDKFESDLALRSYLSLPVKTH